MSTLAHSSWLAPLLRRLPASWLAALDAWSYGVALQQRERRLRSAQRPRPGAPIQYKLRPWRD
jgi:hypothetical protein